jgi:hypothetical protein
MRARKCDRCGKLYEQYKGEKEFRNSEKANAIRFLDFDIENDFHSRRTVDLCPDCMGKLVRFIDFGEETDIPTETEPETEVEEGAKDDGEG